MAGVLGASGCANATSSVGPSSGGPATAVTTSRESTPRTAPPAAVTAAPRGGTTAGQLATRLIRDTRVPKDAVRAKHAPSKALVQPPSASVVDGRIVRARWWRVDRPEDVVYDQVRHQRGSLKNTGGGSTSGPTLGDDSKVVEFQPRHLPSTVNNAALEIAVAPLADGGSAIGVFAVVVRQPRRPAAEHVPSSVDQVGFLRKADATIDGHRAKTLRGTVTGEAATSLVRAFNSLVVQPPGEVFSCPLARYETTLTFTDADHTWVATIPVCPAISVVLDGQALPSLQDSARFGRALDAATKLVKTRTS